MMMALGLQLTAQPRCTLGRTIDGEREEGREGRRKRATEGDGRERLSRGRPRREGRRKLRRLSMNGEEEGGKEGEWEGRREGGRGIIGGEMECRELRVSQRRRLKSVDMTGVEEIGQTERVEGE